MDSTFQGVYENKAKQIFHVAFKRLPTETELERMVKMLKKGGGFYVGQVVDKELLDKVDGTVGCGGGEGIQKEIR